MPDQPSNEALVVMNGYKNLTATQRNEFIKLLNEYNCSEVQGKRVLEEGFQKAAASTGPLGNDTCGCCGR